jgi:hypothetical protein
MTVAIFTTTRKQGRILAMAKVPSRSAAIAMYRSNEFSTSKLRHGKSLPAINAHNAE